jgi:hypothetical protein
MASLARSPSASRRRSSESWNLAFCSVSQFTAAPEGGKEIPAFAGMT